MGPGRQPHRRSEAGAPSAKPARRGAGPVRTAASPRFGFAAVSPRQGLSPANGLPEPLKTNIEAMSGLSMDDVRVHRNSAEPGGIGALAFTQGAEIHLGSGQERHLPHEAWHVVQQKQGRVPITTHFAGAAGNADSHLEREAETMGDRAEWSRALPTTQRRERLAAQPAIQRYMGVGGHKIVMPERIAGSAYNSFLTDLLNTFHRLGFTLSKEGLATVRDWCADEELAPRAFNDLDDVAAALMSLGLSYTKSKGFSHSGPSHLGDRPDFSGEANQLEYGRAHGNTARRHVISSSTLGSAIESSVAELDDIDGFLVRHGGEAVQVKRGEEKAAALVARRRAWELVHNHLGNLWVGPSPINTAIGFIRGPINLLIHRLNSSAGEVKLGEASQAVVKFTGPMDKNAQAEWRIFARVVVSRLTQFADPTGVLDRQRALDDLIQFSRNADLDPPHEAPGPQYQERLRQVYAQILGAIGTGHNIFTKGGTLDDFMALDAGTRVSDSSMGGASTGKAADSAAAPASKKHKAADLLKILDQVPDRVGPHDEYQVRDVVGDGMNCLIRSLLVADRPENDVFVNNDPGNVVLNARLQLIASGFAAAGEMLDLVDAAGAAAISYLVANNHIGRNRGLVLYHRDANSGDVVSMELLGGADPIRIWLSGNHFRAVR
jgi:Domain of unknown function (DUF4157)